MIAAWMVYCIAVGSAIGVAGWAAERALCIARRPTRWAWGVALVLTFLMPGAALLRPKLFGSVTIPLATSASPRVAATSPPVRPSRGLSLSNLDGLVGWGWGVASATLLFALVVGAARIAVLRRRWHSTTIGGREVLVAMDVGPAVVGLWSLQVVIPEWALALPEQQQRLMLSHEAEHVRAKDPWLLAWGTAALIAAPWNPPLWWLVRRLRQAVEMDCDARVVSAGQGPLAYGELLLRVGQRRAHLPIAALALSEPRSLLELRIRRLSAPLPRRRWLGATVSTLVAAATIAGACETPRPVSPQEQFDFEDAGVKGDAVLAVDAVQEKPERLASPMPVYPPLLQRAHVEGVVLIQTIIDTLGQPEPNSLKIISTAHPGFNESAKQFVLHSLFRPARVDGKPVRVLIQIPVRYTIKP